MRGRLLILGVLAALALPAGAEAHLQLLGRNTAPYRRWLSESHVPLPSAKVVLHLTASECGGAEACARPEPWEVWIEPGGDIEARLAFMHEIGHVFDEVSGLSNAQRYTYEQLAGFPRSMWDPNGLDEATSPHEQFASDYARCSVAGPIPVDWGRQSQTNITAICRFIRHL